MFGNIGRVDRIFRGLIGLALGVCAFMYQSLIMAIVSFLIIAMAGFRWCPLYHIFGINTDNGHCCDMALNDKKSILEGIVVSLFLYLVIVIIYFIFKYMLLVE